MTATTPPRVSITIPVLNEEKVLASSIQAIVDFLSARSFSDFEIVIADNGSADSTLAIARTLETRFPFVRAVHIESMGRGRAIRNVWNQSESRVLVYMDIDLSTDLAHLPTLIHAIDSGACDLAVGSRLLNAALTKRGFKRDTISRCYNRLVKSWFHTSFSDAQCGFKAILKPAAQALLPLVENNEWFFDTELLIIAEKLGFRIFDLPVRWTDDPDTRVRIIPTALQDLRGMWRLRRRLAGILANGPRPNSFGRLRESNAGS